MVSRCAEDITLEAGVIIWATGEVNQTVGVVQCNAAIVEKTAGNLSGTEVVTWGTRVFNRVQLE